MSRAITPLLFLADQAHAGRVLVHHPVRAFEVEKDRARGRVPARAEHDLHAALLEEVVRAHDVVDPGHLVVHVLHAGVGRGKQRHAVVHFVDPQERRRADAVRYPRVHHLRPEGLVPHRVRGAQPDV